MELKRKLYSRGNSFETTIPRPMLFALDLSKKYCVVYHFEPETGRWHITFEEQLKKRGDKKKSKVKSWKKSSRN